MSNLRDQLFDVKEKRGVLTPRVVVDEASNPAHPLHSRFEWDDQVAGDLYRIEQAHRLIQYVTRTTKEADGTEKTLREFYAIRREQDQGSPTIVYESLDDLKEDPAARQIVLMDMQRDWRILRNRYESFQEFWQLVGDEAVGYSR